MSTAGSDKSLRCVGCLKILDCSTKARTPASLDEGRALCPLCLWIVESGSDIHPLKTPTKTTRVEATR